MSEILHTGIVRKKNNSEVEVEIVDGVECSTCSLHGACNISETREKFVRVVSDDTDFQEGETVKIQMSHQMAFRALFWAYLFPFIIVIFSIIIISLFVNELVAGLVSILFLFIYYFLIYINKQYFNKIFQLKIKRF